MNSKPQVRSTRVTKKSNNYVSQNRRPEEAHRLEAPSKKVAKNDLASLVVEYLEANNCPKALQNFRQESEKPKQSNEKAALLNMFDSGARDMFFTKLNKSLPVEVRDNSDSFKKLEFYLQVYFFAVKKQSQHNDHASVQYFVNYLETRGEELSKTTELLPYFALPYMPRPAQHKAIQHIFKKKWATDLRQKLSKFLDQSCSTRRPCRLEQLYSNNGRLATNSNNDTTEKQEHLISALEQYKTKYIRLQENYREMTEMAKSNLLDSQSKWFSLARDLVSIGNRFIRVTKQKGLMTPPLSQLAEKIAKYEIFLNSNIDDLIAQSNQGISIFDQPSCSELDASNNQHVTYRQNRSIVPMLSLDYEKIKHFLMNSNDQTAVSLLLQALRWRIIKTRDPYNRREIIMSYSINDVMGIKPENRALLEALFDSESQLVKEHSLRLANVIASDFYGRSYIIQSGNLLEKMVNVVKAEDYDGTIRRCALNALQKVSLRSEAQIFMIESDIIRWIVQTIKLERDDLPDNSLQYLTALLMNMTLKRAGKQKCEKQQILQMLVDLMDNESPQLRTFLCGSIFSLIGQPKLRDEAIRIRLEQQLSRYLQNQPSQFVKQISYILQKLNESLDEDDQQEQEENDIDDIENEEVDDDDDQDEEESDFVEGSEGLDTGENLLIKKFSCVGPEAVRQQCLTRSILEEAVKKNLEISIIREKKTNRSFTNNVFKPTTPAKSSLEILEAMEEKSHPRVQPKDEYNSANYLPDYVSFKKQPINREEEVELQQFASRPLIPRTPPQHHHK